MIDTELNNLIALLTIRCMELNQQLEINSGSTYKLEINFVPTVINNALKDIKVNKFSLKQKR